MLVAARSGTVLYAYNEHEKMQPASLAKIMTFYLTLKSLRDGRMKVMTPITISERAWRLSVDQSVSHMFVDVGQQVTVNDLLYGLMVSSGNDAAVALAEYQAGSAEAFTEQMNQAAQKIGLSETHFANPDGLPVEGEYTTAADMVKLHPYQYVYFNRLVGGGLANAAQRYEADYWGASYREGVEALIRHYHPAPGTRVRVANCGAEFQTDYWLAQHPDAREHFVTVSWKADYDLLLATTRYHYCADLGAVTGRPLYAVQRMGAPLLVAFERRPRGTWVTQAP